MEASKPAEENALPRLDPGTLTKDNDLETMIESGSPLQSYITEAFKASAKSRENKERKKGRLRTNLRLSISLASMKLFSNG